MPIRKPNKYVWNRDDRDEIYDTWADPSELTNRIEDPRLAPVRERLRARLRGWAMETGDPLADAVAG
ncbi:MAG TPA: hypothetical protein VKY56_06535 [Chloroflexota bacterium]|nr:hypothetical protein [Chloroflexota bacterium]